jgi:uncharacterized protein (DUF427 family)
MKPRADPVQPGQESVWDYPRPAIAQATAAHLRIEHRGIVVADTRAGHVITDRLGSEDLVVAVPVEAAVPV